jgi:hypothetical protein
MSFDFKRTVTITVANMAFIRIVLRLART